MVIYMYTFMYVQLHSTPMHDTREFTIIILMHITAWLAVLLYRLASYTFHCYLYQIARLLSASQGPPFLTSMMHRGRLVALIVIIVNNFYRAGVSCIKTCTDDAPKPRGNQGNIQKILSYN